MRNRLSYLLGAPMLLCGAGCGLAGGQSFDDGSGDVGRGRHDHVDGHEALDVLSTRSSVRIMELVDEDDSTGYLRFGQAPLSFVGDLDADGYSDFVISEPPNAYFFYGRSDFPEEIWLSDADFTLFTESPLAIESIGDFNGDGFDDIAIGLGNGGAGLVLGSAERKSGSLGASSIESLPSSSSDYLSALIGPGDVNGDGLADLVLAFDRASRLLLGSEVIVPAALDVDGVTLESVGFSTDCGRSVDLNGDGMRDIVLIDGRGTSFYYGRADWGTLGPIAPDAVFEGWVQGLGDWDGDGYGDLVQVAERRGRSMVMDPAEGGAMMSILSSLSHELVVSYGGPQRLSGILELSRPPSDTFYSDARIDFGDTNGDGGLDLILGSPQNPMGIVDPTGAAGGVFFLAGDRGERRSALTFNPERATLRGSEHEELGGGVAANGDANGDGYQDLLIMQTPSPDKPVKATLIFGGDDL